MSNNETCTELNKHLPGMLFNCLYNSSSFSFDLTCTNDSRTIHYGQSSINQVNAYTCRVSISLNQKASENINEYFLALKKHENGNLEHIETIRNSLILDFGKDSLRIKEHELLSIYHL
jgi:hypothetical protein